MPYDYLSLVDVPVLANVTPDAHPRSVEEELKAAGVFAAPAARGLRACYQAGDELHQLRVALHSDPTVGELQADAVYYKHARERLGKLRAEVESAAAKLDEHRERIVEQTHEKLASPKPARDAEARAHWRSIAEKDRFGALLEAAQDGDRETVWPVISASPRLSGISVEQARTLRTALAQHLCPNLSTAHKACEKAKEKLEIGFRGVEADALKSAEGEGSLAAMENSEAAIAQARGE